MNRIKEVLQERGIKQTWLAEDEKMKTLQTEFKELLNVFRNLGYEIE